LDRAIEACLLVRSQIEKFPLETDHTAFNPKVSIGINSGEMISGNIGSANLRRLDYTVIGDVVNTAQRLQSVAKEGQILIDETSYKKVNEFFQCQKVGEANLKNKKGAIITYEVIG
jgi:adenylate cyclase